MVFLGICIRFAEFGILRHCTYLQNFICIVLFVKKIFSSFFFSSQLCKSQLTCTSHLCFFFFRNSLTLQVSKLVGIFFVKGPHGNNTWTNLVNNMWYNERLNLSNLIRWTSRKMRIYNDTNEKEIKFEMNTYLRNHILFFHLVLSIPNIN